jgi:hypothetical protein
MKAMRICLGIEFGDMSRKGFFRNIKTPEYRLGVAILKRCQIDKYIRMLYRSCRLTVHAGGDVDMSKLLKGLKP